MRGRASTRECEVRAQNQREIRKRGATTVKRGLLRKLG